MGYIAMNCICFLEDLEIRTDAVLKGIDWNPIETMKIWKIRVAKFRKAMEAETLAIVVQEVA